MTSPEKLQCRCAHKVLARPIEDGLPNIAAPCRQTHISEWSTDVKIAWLALRLVRGWEDALSQSEQAQLSALTGGAAPSRLSDNSLAGSKQGHQDITTLTAMRGAA